ncbi:MAG: outer membrane beta-barrel domain-containing protein [Gammaproteobacteria bacterium]|nr:outer membrane beta-barrel domain-containing protein [Gammaproteobacteria bacterium]
MENRIWGIFLTRARVAGGRGVAGRGVFVLAAMLAVCGARAQAPEGDIIGAEPVVQPQLERRTVREDRIDTEDFEIGVFAGVMSVEDFGTSSIFGARLAYHVTEDLFVEAAYGATEAGLTSYERLGGAVTVLTDDERDYSYYNLSLGYNLLPGESFIGRNRAFSSDMYLIGGIGATEFAGDNRFTWNFGAGYRLLLNDWLALHADVRDHMFDIDVLGEDKTAHNIEIHAGATVFF